jgi:hypothetical protein
MELGISKHSLVFDGASAYNGRFTRFVHKTMQDSFSLKKIAMLLLMRNFMK